MEHKNNQFSSASTKSSSSSWTLFFLKLSSTNPDHASRISIFPGCFQLNSHGHRIPSCGCVVCYPVADCGNFGSPKLQAISTIGRNYVVRKPPAELWRHQNRVRGEKFQSFGAASQFTAPYEAAKSGEGVSVSVKSALAG